MSNGIYDLPFKDFSKLVEPIAKGLESSLLFSSASQYNILGLPTVALRLYEEIDSPHTIQSIAQYLASITPVEQSFSFKPSDVNSIESMLDQIRGQITLSPEKANMQALLNAQVAETDPNLAMRVEVEIASNIALTYLLLGKHRKASKYANRLSNLDDAVAQYIANIVHASQGNKNKDIEESMPFIKIGGVKSAKLVERAKTMAHEERYSSLIALIGEYVMYQANVEINNVSRLKDAEDAANMAIKTLGMTGDTAQLLGLVYNRTNRHAEATEILLRNEGSLKSLGKLELALALTLCRKNEDALIHLEQALSAYPQLAELMGQPPYDVLQKLNPQLGLRVGIIAVGPPRDPRVN